MENNLTMHLKMFNDKVKLMNQSQSNHCATISQKLQEKRQDDVVSVGMDGGSF